MTRIWREWKKPILWLGLLTAVYFVLRLICLTALPIFTDEAIYIRWAQIGSRDAAWRFISLTDGKQPLFTWLMMASVRLFQDPLVAGRVVSVVAGFGSLIGLFLLGTELFRKKTIGLVASLLYVLSPFALVYDRLALYDSLVATFFIWNLYLAILLVRKLRLDIALIFGLVLGMGMLNKTSAFLSLYLLPLTLLLFDCTKKQRVKRFLLWVALSVLAAFLSQMVYSVLRLSPFFYIISQKDTLFIYPVAEWVGHPLTFLQGNFHGLFNWLVSYVTWPVLLVAFLAVLIPKKYFLEKLLLLGWWFAPFFALALFGRILYPRFIFFMVMPLYVLASYTIDVLVSSIKRKYIAWLIIFLVCLPSIYVSSRILIDMKTAPIAKGDVGQLINDWPSGWGTKEVVAYLQDASRQGPVAVYTEGTFGLFPYALELYLVDKNVEIHGLWPLSQSIPQEMIESAKKKPTYFVSNYTQEKPLWPIELLATYQKGNNPLAAMHLYRVTPVSYESR